MKGVIFLNFIDNYFFLKNKKTLFIIKNKILCINNIDQYKISKNCNVLVINKDNCIKIKDLIEKISSNLNLFFYKKITFIGKGFKIKKIKNKCEFLFNKSHRILHISKISKLKKTNKNTFIIFNKVNKFSNLIKIFPINLFTKKGLRSSQQKINLKKK